MKKNIYFETRDTPENDPLKVMNNEALKLKRQLEKDFSVYTGKEEKYCSLKFEFTPKKTK